MSPYAAPNKMKYGRTAIVCLAQDLDPAAASREVKRQLAGEDAEDVTLILAGAPINLSEFFSVLVNGKSNRLIIVAHGDTKSTGLFDGATNTAKKWDAKTLATLVFQWVGGYSIGTVSLDACYSGGNRAGAAGTDFANWTVRPRNSFAFEFACHFGIAERVTGRTDYGTTHFLVGNTATAGDRPSYNTVGAGERYHELWDKIIITPNSNARPSNRVEASTDIDTKGKVGAKPPQPLPKPK